MRKIDYQYLTSRGDATVKAGYPLPKWISFCREMLDLGLNVKLYEAKSTVSKYVYLKRGKKEFKVRFSNHKPNKHKEKINDCDFFVGVTNTGVRTTDDAIKEVKRFFNLNEQIEMGFMGITTGRFSCSEPNPTVQPKCEVVIPDFKGLLPDV